MAKLLLLSLPISTLVIPILCSRAKEPRKAFKRTMFFMGLYCAFYAVAVYYVYPRLSV